MNLLAELQQNSPLYLTSLGVLGLIVGSFLNVVVYRLPIMLQRTWTQECHSFLKLAEQTSSVGTFNLSVPRSRCSSCEHLITALENIPVVSYLCLRGRCKSCNTPISLRYPLVELATALIAIAIGHHFGFSLQTAAALLFSWSLITLTLIDFDTQLLPDSICLPLLWFGLFLSLFNVFSDTQSALIGALAGYLSLWAVYWLFKLSTGKEGMGYGDFKLLAAIGAWLGWQALPLVILLSAFVGAVLGTLFIIVQGRDKNTAIPFGPYLSIAGFIALLWGDNINNAYLHFSGF